VESSWPFGRTIDRFVGGLTEKPAIKRTDERVRAVIDIARAADEHAIPDNEHREFLRNLPRWEELSARSQYLPMLAAFALALDPRVPGGPVAHLIIDEAQDVRPLEWRILLNSVLEQGGSVSLFGDMNQRRSDYTASDWMDLAVDLEITDNDGTIAIRELEVGYRSTKQILRFANRLLPRGTRGEKALREGPEPTIRQVPHNQRVAECYRSAADLAQRHEGHVAWITNAPTLANAEFRRKNWVRGQLHDGWTKDDRTVVILHPDQARGIEFDAVVVEEPADFHKNVGRDGVLYTSLTRPNKELVVVHSASLPKELRGRLRR
jgi:DNA helicase-2/ATP-dependent DNA helicase PcrA